MWWIIAAVVGALLYAVAGVFVATVTNMLLSLTFRAADNKSKHTALSLLFGVFWPFVLVWYFWQSYRRY